MNKIFTTFIVVLATGFMLNPAMARVVVSEEVVVEDDYSPSHSCRHKVRGQECYILADDDRRHFGSCEHVSSGRLECIIDYYYPEPEASIYVWPFPFYDEGREHHHHR